MIKFPSVYAPPDTSDVGVDFSQVDSRTKQSFRDECDINVLMRRYLSGGMLPPMANGAGRYGDFSSGVDYLDAQLLVKNAEAEFASLPAHIRDRFRNNPFELLEFVSQPENREEARKLGLLRPEAAAAAQAVSEPKVEGK